MKTTPSDEPDKMNGSEPKLVLAMKRWQACAQHGCVQPPVEEGLRDLLLDYREVKLAISWCTDLERLPLLQEILTASDAALQSFLNRSDFTFSECLKVYRHASEELKDITERMQRRKAINQKDQSLR